MKKLFGYITIIAAASLAFFGITSCIINDKNPQLLPSPTIADENEDSSYTITFASDTNMKYANIIRMKASTQDFSDYDKANDENIGQIVPTNPDKLASAFVFKDMDTAPGTYYKYRIRYFNGSIYKETEPTETAVLGKHSGEAEIQSADVSFNYLWNDHDSIYSLELTQDIAIPQDFSYLAFVVSNKAGMTRPFLMAEPTNDDKVTIECSEINSVDLQRSLSPDFLDDDITMEGIIAIKEFTDNTGDTNTKYKRYYWTKQQTISVTTRFINSNNDEDAPPSGNVIKVPSIKNKDNIFDISRNAVPSIPSLSIK